MHKTCLYQSATGNLPYRLTNDYLFRALLQSNNNVLKHLTCSLTHTRPEEVKSVVIQNPIELGKAMDDKSFILDVKVLLNDRSVIDYEMQVANLGNWPERSLLYLCRMFDQLQKGEDYVQAQAVTHIGLLDFTLFPEYPEFFATYRMENIKSHHIYTDKFTLCVLDLNQLDRMTEEDKEWHIDDWASLFKATTWEEIKMFAEKNEVLQDAAETLYLLTEDDMIREQCLRRQEYQKTWDKLTQIAQERGEKIEQQAAELAKKDAENRQLLEENARLKELLAQAQN